MASKQSQRLIPLPVPTAIHFSLVNTLATASEKTWNIYTEGFSTLMQPNSALLEPRTLDRRTLPSWYHSKNTFM